ncbi:hypothetical protein COY65_02230 [Candidatus Jorgensenbacteria bacterium CG_4_10_14_0_8_um_filter_39_13]|uniref:Uncharacterized protein n=2 Tax=Candidatus Joergenseniibacteriota TaxID=1752739 RepID=A0A2M7RGI7_9BACT|nr:MAG: hypothetical protein COV54_03135 [Candidatus Jorgensenbacteria bacterium CG11_big_fil_rev_8_21_14_0_20_38_23]PIV13047.1 MAG: hypothetical protein COS46_02475 [Candidatus Jorgensenbacteria bacterium CG03_land_8_20_14_0_80_38_39]PIY95875.1 MAG: hypothetical protein COY65_02230 [Candidatus Jorgensenbacteria bacterium CG_4_10_14_0_8_um_filter_39_13]PJA94716.1 MAG: hypothetical protein CO130_03020 [Candidatus Jorgensenbacteria bacterium CG_4_9_14_3_um_filter_38_10]
MKKKILTFIIIIISLGLLVQAKAQTSEPSTQVILTWQANNYFPADYPLKALATPMTPILVSAELIKDNKIIDISKADFLWYVNNKYFNRGIGLKEILINVPVNWLGPYLVRTEIQLEQNNYGNSVSVNIAEPQVIIDYPSPIKTFKEGEQIVLRSVPYFFNANNFQDFNFFWKINLHFQKELNNQNPVILTVSKDWANTDNSFRIGAGVENKTSPLIPPQETSLTFYLSQ